MVETPDTENSGLINMLSIGCEITSETSTQPLLEILRIHCPQGLREIAPNYMRSLTRIFLNGEWVGVHNDHSELVKDLRNLRRQSCIHHEVDPLFSWKFFC
jgi:DNA-directed RNA polymerase II subunit RPB2